MSLASSSEIKAILGITSTDYDAQIAALLDPVSALIEKEAGRKFTPSESTEYHPGGEPTIALGNFPIEIGGSPSMVVTDMITGEELVYGTDYAADATRGLLRRLPYGSRWARATIAHVVYLGVSQGVNRWQISYTGGPSSVPGDIQLAMASAISSMLTTEGAGASSLGGIVAESDGDYSYQRGSSSASGGVMTLPAQALDICRSYRAGVFI